VTLGAISSLRRDSDSGVAGAGSAVPPEVTLAQGKPPPLGVHGRFALKNISTPT